MSYLFSVRPIFIAKRDRGKTKTTPSPQTEVWTLDLGLEFDKKNVWGDTLKAVMLRTHKILKKGLLDFIDCVYSSVVHLTNLSRPKHIPACRSVLR